MRVAALLVLLAEHGFTSSVGPRSDDQPLQMSEKSVHAEAVHEETVHKTEVFDTPNENCTGFDYTWQVGFPSLFPHKGMNCPRKRNVEWQSATCPWKEKFPKGANIAFIHVGKASGSTLSMSLTRAIKYNGLKMNISELHTGSDRPGYGLEQLWDLAIIATREPASRTISALNYEMEASHESLAHKKLISKLVDCYPFAPGGANNFSRDLGEDSYCGQVARRCLLEDSSNYHPTFDAYHAATKPFNPKENFVQSYCGHINMGHAHYLNKERFGVPSIMTQLRLGTLKAWVVRTESFDEDMDGLFKWLCIDKFTAKDAIPEQVVPQVTQFKSSDRHGDTNVEPKNMVTLKAALASEYQTLEALEQLVDNGKITSGVERIAAMPKKDPMSDKYGHTKDSGGED